jgi:hypothetical protein
MQPKVVDKPVAPDALKVLLEVMPREREERKSGKELVSMLRARGINMTLRALQAAVMELRQRHGAVIGSLPGDGYFIISNETELQETLRYSLSLAKKHVKTYNEIKHSWHNQPTNGGRQLDLVEIPVKQVAPAPKPEVNYIELVKGQGRTALTEEQALEAVRLYWKSGAALSLKIVAERVGATKGVLQGFWDRLQLPIRSRGGHGLPFSERNYESCARRMKTFFEKHEDGCGD